MRLKEFNFLKVSYFVSSMDKGRGKEIGKGLSF